MRNLDHQEIITVAAGCLGWSGLNSRERGLIWATAAFAGLTTMLLGGITAGVQLCKHYDKLDDATCADVKYAMGTGVGFGAIGAAVILSAAAKLIHSDPRPASTIIVSNV